MMSNVLGDDWDENDAKQLSRKLEAEYSGSSSTFSLLDYLRQSMTDEQIYAAYERGHYKPLYDDDYEAKAQEWLKNCMDWEAGTHPDLVEDPELKNGIAHFWEWDGSPPDKEYYRPAWKPEEMTHYQMYETVSEGTPVSPVFETLEELKRWMIGEGYSEQSASAFIKSGWAPSLVFSPQTGVVSGIEFLGMDT